MKDIMNRAKTWSTGPRTRNARLLGLGMAAAMACCNLRADHDGAKANHYEQFNLVADLPGVAALQDTNLVNAWGISFSSTSPFWVSDNGTGKSTLYSVTNNNGMLQVTKLGLVVTIPGEGTPTGQLFNGTGLFHHDIFIFASEDGVISGWRGALGTTAEVLVNDTNAVYKGITMAMTTAHGPVLLVANFHNATVDAYDTNLTLVAQYADPHAPAGYAPFNVMSVNGMIFVTYAMQNAEMHDDVAGPGHGLIDVLNPDTGMFHRFATGSAAGGHLRELNSPWGMALAPDSFGKHGAQLLVGNFGSGTIMSFEADGKFRGLLQAVHHGPLVIDGLWGLAFGNGGAAGTPDTLFFTAGPDGESHGLFGAIKPAQKVKNRDDDDGD